MMFCLSVCDYITRTPVIFAMMSIPCSKMPLNFDRVFCQISNFENKNVSHANSRPVGSKSKVRGQIFNFKEKVQFFKISK